LILSADVGDSSRAQGYYARALESFDVKPDSCVFIDKTRKNLEVPSAWALNNILGFETNDIAGLTREITALED